MRIQHNIMAMSAYRNYTNNVSAMKKNLEKLSSGYKINRAGDDAAGLAISEKMRAQITGLETAQKNAKDGISLVQTAEGALTEVHDMLNRMVELATQSANGTYSDTTDREQLQKEVEQLKSEINRISKAANFNGIQLLDGSMDSTGTVAGKDTSVDVLDITGAFTSVADGSKVDSASASKGKFTIDFSQQEFTVSGASNAQVTIAIKVGGVTVAVATASGGSTVTAGQFTAVGTTVAFGTSGPSVSMNLANGKLTFELEKDPTTQAEVDAINGKAGGLKVTVEGVEESTNGNVGNQGHTLSVKPEKLAALKDEKLYAQGQIDLSKLGIKDGSVLTIDGKDYQFALGANSKLKKADGTLDAGVIDLTKFETMTADAAKSAAQQIAAQADPDHLMITTPNNDGTINLVEKNFDYDKYDFVGSTGVKDATWKAKGDAAALMTFAADGKATDKAGKALTLQIGDTNEDFNQITVDIKSCDATAIGIANVNISTQAGAQSAIADIKAAINYVSDVRGTLGATQNRLDHTINNLSVMTENIQDAESTIRDVDVAEEMMAYTKNNILIQSAQAMLAQANQVPQGVLQLLQ